MSLIYCPECGHEISNAAIACPNCGRPLNPQPFVERKVVVPDDLPRHRSVPTWAIATVGVMGILLLFLLIGLWSRSGPDEGNRWVRVNMNGQYPSKAEQQTTSSGPTSVTSVPPTTGDGSINVPSSETSVGGSQVSLASQPTKGTAVIRAKVVTRNNTPQPVRNQRFYLLDKDVESVLTEAGVEPIAGQTMINSLGLAALFPDRYGDFQRRALAALKNHIKYAGMTDSTGRAQLGGIQPDSYYLFGVVRAGNGFAIWSSPVSIVPGENVLDLTPQPVTEIDRTSG
jgi:hypothetical protein